MAASTNSTIPPVTTPAGLGFASRAKAFTQARDAARRAEEGPALDAAAEAEYAAAEALIETPAATPAQIAEKVAALMEVHNTGGTGQDLGMKSIRRDLIALDAAQTEARAAWEAALAAYEAARAKADALLGGPDDTDDLYDAATDEAWSLLETLLATPAPDGAAMGVKARVIIAQAHSDWQGDSPDNPLTIARLLAGDWSEQALASLYIDGLRLSGSDSPIIAVQPDGFDAAAWLATVEAETGARLSKSDPWNNVAFVATRDGADAAGAEARLAALYKDHADTVEIFAANRDRDVDLSEPLPPLTPAERERGRAALIDALANLSAPGPDRDAMRDKIAEAATPWVLTVEKRGTGARVNL